MITEEYLDHLISESIVAETNNLSVPPGIFQTEEHGGPPLDEETAGRILSTGSILFSERYHSLLNRTYRRLYQLLLQGEEDIFISYLDQEICMNHTTNDDQEDYPLILDLIAHHPNLYLNVYENASPGTCSSNLLIVAIIYNRYQSIRALVQHGISLVDIDGISSPLVTAIYYDRFIILHYFICDKYSEERENDQYYHVMVNDGLGIHPIPYHQRYHTTTTGTTAAENRIGSFVLFEDSPPNLLSIWKASESDDYDTLRFLLNNISIPVVLPSFEEEVNVEDRIIDDMYLLRIVIESAIDWTTQDIVRAFLHCASVSTTRPTTVDDYRYLFEGIGIDPMEALTSSEREQLLMIADLSSLQYLIEEKGFLSFNSPDPSDTAALSTSSPDKGKYRPYLSQSLLHCHWKPDEIKYLIEIVGLSHEKDLHPRHHGSVLQSIITKIADYTSLSTWSLRDNDEYIHYLIDDLHMNPCHKDTFERNILFNLCRIPALSCNLLKYLVYDCHVNPTLPDLQGTTLLMCFLGRFCIRSLFSRSIAMNLSIIEFFVNDCKIMINARNVHGDNVLHLLLSCCDLDDNDDMGLFIMIEVIVKKLIELGVDDSVVNYEGQSIKDTNECVYEYLLKRGVLQPDGSRKDVRKVKSTPPTTPIQAQQNLQDEVEDDPALAEDFGFEIDVD